jgi:hypothetical protein
MKSGNLNFLEPAEPLQACNGIDLLLTMVDRERFFVFGVDSWVQNSSRLCCNVKGIRPSRDGSLLPDNLCGNSPSKMPRNLTWKCRGPLLRLSEIVCHLGPYYSITGMRKSSGMFKYTKSVTVHVGKEKRPIWKSNRFLEGWTFPPTAINLCMWRKA